MEKDNKIEDITKKRHEDFKNKVNERADDKSKDNGEEVELLSSLIVIGEEIRDNNKSQCNTLTFELKERLKGMSDVIGKTLSTLPTQGGDKNITSFMYYGIMGLQSVLEEVLSTVKDININVNVNAIDISQPLDAIVNILMGFEESGIGRTIGGGVPRLDPEDNPRKKQEKKKKENDRVLNKLIDSFGKSQYNILRIMRDQMFEFTRTQASRNKILLSSLKGIVYNPVTKTIIARLGEINRSIKTSGKSLLGGLDMLFGGTFSSLFGLFSSFFGKMGKGLSVLTSTMTKGVGAKVMKAGAVVGVATSAIGGYNKIQAIKEDESLTEEQKSTQIREAKFETGGQVAGGVIGGILGSFLGPVGTMIGSMLGDFVGGWFGKLLSRFDFSNIMGDIKDVMNKFFKETLPNIGNMVKDVFGNIMDMMPSTDEIVNFLLGTLDLMVDNSLKVVDFLVDGLTKGFDLIVDEFINFLDNIPQLLAKGVELIFDIIPKLGSIIFNVIKGVTKLIFGSIPKIYKLLKGALSAGLDLVVKLGKSFGSFLVDVFFKLPDIIMEIVETLPGIIWEGIKSLGRSFMDKVQETLFELMIWIDGYIPDILSTDEWKNSIVIAKKTLEERERKLQEENEKLLKEKQKSIENEKKLLGLEEEKQELRFTANMLSNRLSDDEEEEIKKRNRPTKNELEFLDKVRRDKKPNEIDFLNTVLGVGDAKVTLHGEPSLRTTVLNNEYITSKDIETINNITPVILNNSSNIVNNETRTQSIRFVNTQNMDFTNNRYNLNKFV